MEKEKIIELTKKISFMNFTNEQNDFLIKLLDGEIKKIDNAMPKFLPCSCGNKRKTELYCVYQDLGKKIYECKRCGFKTIKSDSKRELIECWNNHARGITE